jgi:hypothetical protein
VPQSIDTHQTLQYSAYDKTVVPSQAEIHVAIDLFVEGSARYRILPVDDHESSTVQVDPNVEVFPPLQSCGQSSGGDTG